MKLKHNKIDIIVRTTSPMYIAYPENYDDKRKISYTVKKPLMTRNGMVSLPYYPGNGFRGGLRRMAASRIETCLAETEAPIPGDLYNGLRCGASSGSPDQTALSIEEIVRVRSHVYMGLFGGGARIHESMYSVSDMNPIIKTTVDLGMVPKSCQDFVVSVNRSGEEPSFVRASNLTGERTSIRMDDLYTIEDPEGLMRVVANPVETVKAHQLTVGLNKEEKKNDPEAKKADVRNMMTFESIAEGVPMHFRITMDNQMTEGQLGLLLLSLSDLFNENAFGGWVRIGMGKVKVESMSLTYADHTQAWDNLYDDERFVLPEDVLRYANSAEQEICSLKIAELATYFEDFSAAKKAEKKAKKSAAAEAA